MTASPRDPSGKGIAPHTASQASPKAGDPALIEGLKDLYGAVVEEPLPAALADLLARLDEQDGK